MHNEIGVSDVVESVHHSVPTGFGLRGDVELERRRVNQLSKRVAADDVKLQAGRWARQRLR